MLAWASIIKIGGDRIRTYVDVSQRVYSPSPLATRAPLPKTGVTPGGDITYQPFKKEKSGIKCRIAVYKYGSQADLGPVFRLLADGSVEIAG